MSASMFSLCCPSQKGFRLSNRLQSASSVFIPSGQYDVIYTALHKEQSVCLSVAPRGSANDGHKMTSVPLRWR